MYVQSGKFRVVYVSFLIKVEQDRELIRNIFGFCSYNENYDSLIFNDTNCYIQALGPVAPLLMASACLYT